MTQTCTANAPGDPNASLMTPEYVVVSPECVKRRRNSTESSASTATTIIMVKAGTTPRTFMIAGIDMIPAPTMLVATLNTAPDTDAGVIARLDSPNNGTLTPAAGDMAAKKVSGWENEVRGDGWWLWMVLFCDENQFSFLLYKGITSFRWFWCQ